MSNEELPRLPPSPFGSLIGLKIDKVNRQEVHGHVDLRAIHHQPMGITHGGVYMSVIEELASLGANQHVDLSQRIAVGVSQETNFLRPSRHGSLLGVARPVHIDQDNHIWEVELRRPDDRELVAQGVVRLKVVDLAVVGHQEPARA